MDEKLANPAPLGLMGFGMTTVLLNIHNAGFYPLDSMILAMGLAYGGLAQIIAGIMEYRKGNTFGTTAFSVLGSPGGGIFPQAFSEARSVRRVSPYCFDVNSAIGTSTNLGSPI